MNIKLSTPTLRVLPCLALGLALLGTGCASFKLKHTPPGFIEVSSSDYDGEAELRMKAPDNVGINITTESNFRGGTLSLWADDMIRKLGERGYVLVRQDAVKSANGVEGTRFDFRYNPPGGDGHERFYTAILFVTDHWRVIAQLAGRVELEPDHQADLDKVIGEIKIRGCKVASKVCGSGQPRQFETAAATKPNKADDQGDDANDDGDDPKPKAKPNGGGGEASDEPAEPAPEAEAEAGQ